MTDTTEPTPTPDTTTIDEAVEVRDESDPRLDRARREARNLRDRLRATEEERDTLAVRIEELTATADGAQDRVTAAEERATTIARRRVEELAEAWGMVDGADLWRHGADLTDALDDDTGGIDPSRVGDLVRRVASDRRHLLGVNAAAFRAENVNPDLTTEQRLRWGVEPAPDAPAEEWETFKAQHRIHGAANRRRPAGEYAEPTLGSVLHRRLTGR